MERRDVGAVLAMMMALNRAGHAIDPRYQVRADAEATLRDVINHEWLGVFRPFPAAFVAEVGGQLAGYIQGDLGRPHPILVEPPKAKIGNLWVQPQHRRKGLASALVAAYITAAKGAGIDCIEVGTLGTDERAVAFWRSVGFSDWRITLIRQG
jgi:ribosomal protein S18 acetylase RimI-like enzyme